MSNKVVIQDFISDQHNHETCIDEAIKQAETVCANRQERFTSLRKTILKLVWGSHKPVKAYDLLAQLAEYHESPAPVTVYRALSFLQEAGLVHKIQSLNAFVGCGAPLRQHQGQFLICSNCGLVAELDDSSITSQIESNAKKVGFKVSEEIIEISGLCAKCQLL